MLPDMEAMLTIAPAPRGGVAQCLGLAGEEGAGEVDREHALPLRLLHRLRRRRIGDAGAVDGGGERSEPDSTTATARARSSARA